MESSGVPEAWSASTDALTQALSDNGTRLASDPARLRGSINDVLGVAAETDRAQVDALVVAAEEGVATSLLARRRGEDAPDDEALASSLLARGFSPEYAAATLGAWATALSSGPVTLPKGFLPETDALAATAAAAAVGAGLTDAVDADATDVVDVPETAAVPGEATEAVAAATVLGAGVAAAGVAAAGVAAAGDEQSPAPTAPAQNRGRVGLVAALVAGVLLLAGGGAWAATRVAGSSQAQSGPTSSPSSTSPMPSGSASSESPTSSPSSTPSDSPTATPSNSVTKTPSQSPDTQNPSPKQPTPTTSTPAPVVNHAPALVAGKPATYSTTYKVGSSTVSLASFFRDIDGDPWSIASASAGKGAVSLVSCGGAAKCLKYKPTSRLTKADTITYRVADSSGAMSPAYRVSLKVVVPNHAPAPTVSSQSVNLACPATGYCGMYLSNPTFKDADGDAWVLTGIQTTFDGYIGSCSESVHKCAFFIPPPPGMGQLTVSLQATDALGAKSAWMTLSITVT